MREIKFRAWDGTAMSKNTATIQEIAERGPQRNPYNLIWMQYTGLKDKNGKEIYEGDIVKGIGPKYFGPVIFKNGCFCWLEDPIAWEKDYNEFIDTEGFAEVIGNIYDNPELLNP